MLLLLAGGVALVVDQGQAGGNQLWGLLALLLATVAWGADNTLFRSLAERDPGQVVLGKALLGASATTILALAFGDPLPSLGAALALLAVGATAWAGLPTVALQRGARPPNPPQRFALPTI